jgi:hypothetical protein
MNLITIFNYPKDNVNYTKMCELWLYFAFKYKGTLNVKIFTENGVNESIKSMIDHYGFELLKLERTPISWSDPKFKHNIGFKLFNLCKETEPFVFIDADAYILKSLDTLVRTSNNQRMVMIDHETVPGHTTHIPYKFLNSGVQVCNDPTILIYDEIIKEKIIAPGSDQSLLYSYFKTINYDYKNPNIGFEWNSFAKYVNIEYKDNEWVGVSSGLDYVHPVYINHYWYDAKPWQINCPIFTNTKNYENIPL